MSISSETRKAGPYVGTGAIVALPFSFKVFSAVDVLVVRTDLAGLESNLALATDYAVALNADQDAAPGGTVTPVVAPSAGYLTTIISAVGALQPVVLTNAGGFYPKVINDALDRLTMLVQQVKEQVGRSIKVGISSSATPDQLIDALNTSASNAANSATAASSSASTASSSATNASNSAAAAATNASNSAAAAAASAASIALPLPVASGGTGATTAAAARTAFGLDTIIDPSQFSKLDPFSPALVKTGANTLSIKAGTRLRIASAVTLFLADTPVSMPSLTAGTDYSVWVKTDGTAVAVADPFSSPAAAPAAGAKKIGGFHYGLTAAGTTPAGGAFATAGFTNVGGSMIWTQASVDRIAGINEFSIWDLAWCCVGEQHGMALDPQTQTWLGIYWCSTNHIVNGISAYNTDIASGTVLPRIPLAFGGNGTTTYGQMSWYEACEIAASHSLRVPTYAEFASAMFGVTEGQSLGGASVTVPATKREPGYTSRIGIEQATGHQYAFGPAHSVGGSAWAGVGRGSFYGTSGLCMLGGYRSEPSYSGSRSAYFNRAPTYSAWDISLRAAGDHKKIIGQVRG